MSKTIIVGGGIAGLASAIRLRHAGVDVELFEMNERVGGKMNVIHKDGFTFDTGPTIVMMPEEYRELFTLVGRNPDDYFTMSLMDPFFTMHYPDGTKLEMSSDLSKLMKVLESVDAKDAQGYLRYLSDVYGRYQIARNHFLNRSFRSIWDFVNPKSLLQAYRLKSLDTAYKAISRYVKNDRLRKLFSFQTLYIGISPYSGPSIYSIIGMIQLVYGVWFIKGGMIAYVDALERLAKELGVVIHTSTKVDEVVLENGKAVGVKVKGNVHHVDNVLLNADFPSAIQQLVPQEKQRKPYTDARIDRMESSCSTFMMYLGIDRKLDKLDVHNLYFTEDFDRNIAEIFEGTLPDDPSMYFYCPAKLDPSLAPEGQETLYVLVPIPNLKVMDEPWTDETTQKYRQVVLERIKKSGLMPDLEDHIVSETIWTPVDWESRFNAHFGATFGLAPTIGQSLVFRPQTTVKGIKNLYAAGSSIHPGAGVPIVMLSSKLAVADILRDAQ